LNDRDEDDRFIYELELELVELGLIDRWHPVRAVDVRGFLARTS
jgi:hypothetical protein